MENFFFSRTQINWQLVLAEVRKGFQPCFCAVFLTSPNLSMSSFFNTEGRFNLLRAGVRYAEETWGNFFLGNLFLCRVSINPPEVCKNLRGIRIFLSKQFASCKWFIRNFLLGPLLCDVWQISMTSGKILFEQDKIRKVFARPTTLTISGGVFFILGGENIS